MPSDLDSFREAVLSGSGPGAGGPGAGDRPGEPASFGEALSSLESGAALLVADPAGGARPLLCRRLLGSPDHATQRRRLFAAGTPDPVVADRLDPDASAAESALRVVAWERPGADAGTAGEGASGSGVPFEAVEADDLFEWGLAVADAMGDLAGQDPPDGALRVCLADLAPLVGALDPGTAAGALGVLCTRAVRLGGVVHVHAPPDGPLWSALAERVDGRIEVRDEGDAPEQRWTVRGATSGWIPLREGHDPVFRGGSSAGVGEVPGDPTDPDPGDCPDANGESTCE